MTKYLTNNFAVMNIIDSHTTPNWTASNGNLDISWVGPNYTNHLFSSLSMPPTGKWYFEIKFVSDSNQILYYQAMRIGLMRDDFKVDCWLGNDYIDGEGYVMAGQHGTYKLVDRETFSYYNFNIVRS